MPTSPGRALLLCLLCCAGCAAPRPPGSPPLAPEVADGEAILTTLGTPFHALFKATACVLSTAIAAPSAAALAITDRPQRDREVQELARGVGRNCYGSYALQPS
jgi:hypothetical protein